MKKDYVHRMDCRAAKCPSNPVSAFHLLACTFSCRSFPKFSFTGCWMTIKVQPGPACWLPEGLEGLLLKGNLIRWNQWNLTTVSSVATASKNNHICWTASFLFCFCCFKSWTLQKNTSLLPVRQKGFFSFSLNSIIYQMKAGMWSPRLSWFPPKRCFRSLFGLSAPCSDVAKMVTVTTVRNQATSSTNRSFLVTLSRSGELTSQSRLVSPSVHVKQLHTSAAVLVHNSENGPKCEWASPDRIEWNLLRRDPENRFS